MHSYLRSIGFGDAITSEYDVEKLLADVFGSFDYREAVKEEDGKRAFVELKKSYNRRLELNSAASWMRMDSTASIIFRIWKGMV